MNPLQVIHLFSCALVFAMFPSLSYYELSLYNIKAKSLCGHIVLFLLFKMGLFSHSVDVSLAILETAKPFSRRAVPFHILTSNV